MENQLLNNLVDSDSYKTSHMKMYPPNTTSLFSYLESRGGRFGTTIFFGLQYLLKEYFTKPISIADVEQAHKFFAAHGVPFNTEGWMRIAKLGYLPVKIKAVAEGSEVPTHNILMSVESTDPETFWIASWIETQIVRMWYPITVATQSYYVKKAILEALEESANDPWAEIPFKLHDFGSRGVSSRESAGIGGMSHLVNFQGSDTIAGVLFANHYYNHDMAAFSIPASEHSTITSWGKDREFQAYQNIVNQFCKPGKIVACVSDSYDLFNVLENVWGGDLRDEIKNSGGTVVIRPDCYDDQTEILTHSGWKLFKNLVKDELVAQYKEDNTIEWVKPLEYIEQHYSGEMYHFYNEHRLDLVVTPNHRLVCRNNENDTIKIKEAKDAKFYYKYGMIRAAKLPDKEISLTPFERFLIAFQADGSFNSSHKDVDNPGVICGHITVRFNFSKERKEKRLIDICKKAGLIFTINTTERANINQNVIYVQVPVGCPLFKQFKDWVNVSDRDCTWCQQFIEEVSYWDATRRTNTRYKYDSTIESNSDIVQRAAIFAGYGCTYSILEDNRKDIFNDIHSLTICAKKQGGLIGGQGINKEIINYDGKIYCVKVPSGMIVVRRNKRVVVSGNSGDPVEIVLKCLQVLERKVGMNKNLKGFKVLPPYLRVIQGDGVNEDSIKQILKTIMNNGYSASNVAFGMGGKLLQAGLDRDTQRFAFKCSEAVVEGKSVAVFKDPVTDKGKRSKAGRLDLVHGSNGFETVLQGSSHLPSSLHDVFENGKILKEYSLNEVRKTAEKGLR